MAVDIFDLKTTIKTDEVAALERAVIEAAIAWKSHHLRPIGTLPREYELQQRFDAAVDALIAAREKE